MLVDSNILIYAINRSSPKHKQAQKFLLKQQTQLNVAHQNIFETIRVLTHPKFPKPMRALDAIKAVLRITNELHTISPTYNTHHLALELIKKHKLVADSVFDACLVATMLSNGIETIATDNVKDFLKYKCIKIINPFSGKKI